MRAFAVQFGAREGILCVRAGLRLAQAIRSDQLRGSKLRKIFLFLRFGAEIDNWQSPDSRVGSMGDGKPSIDGKLFGENSGRNLVQARTAVFFGNPATHQSELSTFSDQFRHESRLLVFQILCQRQNLFQNKLFRGLSVPPEMVQDDAERLVKQ